LGYSARYHAASLAAVFLALAVGILIGAGLGDNLLSDTEENLRESLEGDIEDARGDADELRAQLDRERAFTSSAYPALVGDTLADRRIGLLAFGDLPGNLSADVQDALEPTGGELVEVAVVRRPPDLAALAAALAPGRFAGIDEDTGQLEELAELLGSQFALSEGKQLERVRETLFSRSSGEGGSLDGVVLARAPVGELDPEDEPAVDALETGLVSGVADAVAPTVAVERSGDEESSIPFFGPFDVATVDSVDLTSGKVALVFTLLGAEGNFGVKGTANSLLPELLEPSRQGGSGR
jgi:hypothetical protein